MKPITDFYLTGLPIAEKDRADIKMIQQITQLGIDADIEGQDFVKLLLKTAIGLMIGGLDDETKRRAELACMVGFFMGNFFQQEQLHRTAQGLDDSDTAGSA